MSYDGIDNKDLPLKLRIMNVLWHLGWFVRPNVKLYMYYEGHRTGDLFTDIDVLAIRMLALHKPLVAICSAKSGKESDSAQIFWLNGVRSYLDADFAYYLRSQADLRKARPLCDKLGIVPINEEQLKAVEKRLFSNGQRIPFMFTIEAYAKTNGYFQELRKAKPTLYDYLTERYWIDPEYLQLMRVITGIRDISKLSLRNECSIFIKYYLATLSALSIIRLSQRFVTTPLELLKTELDTTLKGGELARAEKEMIATDIKNLLEDMLKHTTISREMVDKGIDFEKMFKLDYFDDLLDLVIRLVEHYSKSVYIPRMLDVLSFALINNPSEIPDPSSIKLPELSDVEQPHTAKLTKDALVFLHRIGGLDKSEIC